ncbi:MAG TPA: hypothetical protein VFL62_16095 [Bradyrhizobium sp.]|uniref:hypothetical protein n=1 Tax=Bradyrhizobium sp. TaxID=376 RepID=UPI002D7E1870|nr:hypothetical protein [Bradyrhizobium sp.]HET7887746.1 hypothetical protein [Bradyrhizobium sp.]
MGKSATRLCTLMACAAIVVTSVAAPAKAAAGGGIELIKNKRKVQNGPGVGESRSASPSWPPPMYDDFDRKNAGGGGGM